MMKGSKDFKKRSLSPEHKENENRSKTDKNGGL